MKLTESYLKKIIAEEIQQLVDEGMLDRLVARTKGGIAGLKGKAKSAVVGGMGKVASWADEEAGQKLAARSADLKKSAAASAAATKLNSIVTARTNELVGDLAKLGIKPTGKVEDAIKNLQAAITASAKQMEE